jgi:hypothetical protein
MTLPVALFEPASAASLLTRLLCTVVSFTRPAANIFQPWQFASVRHGDMKRIVNILAITDVPAPLSMGTPYVAVFAVRRLLTSVVCAP